MVVHRKAFPDHSVVFMAKGKDVPLGILRVVLLDVGSRLDGIHAFRHGTIGGFLPTEFEPMVEPVVAFAVHIGDSVNVDDFHDFLLKNPFSLEGRRLG